MDEVKAGTERLETPGDIGIAKTICEQQGHEFVAISHRTFNRDWHGNAFCGYAANSAAQFSVLFCRRCGKTMEIQIVPKLSFKTAPPKPAAEAKPAPEKAEGAAAE
jgi:hypothetical protein